VSAPPCAPRASNWISRFDHDVLCALLHRIG